ncbi:hypothetical protein BDN71DRAFT_1590385 [Pleurotus eryngii]|uniref:Uncharacterized protein n=1 Tax=Pleurotus eryngii TaxID=5323 RepID=A0A9P6D2G1_PLEER|nr:hypothetical protein BDN71DRAFT_1593141 [Pleurotus eryngii]KAF9494529.1 hypothetical protein BDN71DRAFT_1590385 [Pleurotus eryngii]
MVKKLLSSPSEMLENPKEQQKANKFFSALEQGDDDLRYLYGIFQKSKNLSKASRIVANFALAAAGLCAAMEGKEILEKWEWADKQTGAEYLQQHWRTNSTARPSWLNDSRESSPPSVGPLSSPPNTGLNISGNPNVGIVKGDNGGGQDNLSADRTENPSINLDASKGNEGGSQDSKGSGKHKCRDNNNDEMDDDADWRENSNISLDAGKGGAGGSQKLIGSRKCRHRDDDDHDANNERDDDTEKWYYRKDG